jgi:hypothetical protein
LLNILRRCSFGGNVVSGYSFCFFGVFFCIGEQHSHWIF